MAIVDQWGNSVYYSRQAARGADRTSMDRPWEPVRLQDIQKLVPAEDRKTLMSAARAIHLNFGPITGAIRQRGMYSVGRGYLPVFSGTDKDFGDAATEWLIQKFYPIGDARGGMHDLRTNLFTYSSAIDIDGDIFILLTETDNGFPKYQGIPAHRIANPRDLSDGPMRGGKLCDGVIYYPSGEPKEYAFLNEDFTLNSWIPAQNLIQAFDPEWQYQGRGISGLTHCINDCRDSLQAHEWERLAMLQLSSISILEYNEHGGPDMDDNGNVLTGNTETGQGVTVKKMDGGTIRYFKSNSGGKLETLKNDRPGTPWIDYNDRIIRSGYFGLNWPYSFWKGNGMGGGTAQRTEIALAQRSVEDRQDILDYVARRIVSYAVAKAVKRGDLPKSADWWKWDFTKPAKLTIDDGRITKELETLWKIGAVNMREIVGMRGNSLEKHYNDRADEIALRIKAKEAAEAKYGVEIDDREMAMLTPNEQSETTQNNESSND